MAVNVHGPIHAARAFLPGMIARRRGRIVLVGSLAGRMGGLIAGPHYVASKGAVHALVKWLARQAAPHGVLVNGIAPASVATPMMDGPAGRPRAHPARSHGAAGGDRRPDRLPLLGRRELHLRRRARRQRRRLYELNRRESPTPSPITEVREVSLVPDYPIVDSHVHLCEPARFGYAWTRPRNLTKAAAPVVIDQIADWVVEGCAAGEKRKPLRDDAISFYRLDG